MKVIFLDVDGVLNPNRWRDRNGSHEERWIWPEKVALLKDLVARTDARICVSSTWRIGDGYTKLVVYLVQKHGFERRWFVGRTPDHATIVRGIYVADRRGGEIADWLRTQGVKLKVQQFVILDDDSDMGDLKPYLVQTDSGEGLTAAHVERAVVLLNAERPSLRV